MLTPPHGWVYSLVSFKVWRTKSIRILYFPLSLYISSTQISGLVNRDQQAIATSATSMESPQAESLLPLE
jgi:hypothetical protein